MPDKPYPIMTDCELLDAHKAWSARYLKASGPASSHSALEQVQQIEREIKQRAGVLPRHAAITVPEAMQITGMIHG